MSLLFGHFQRVKELKSKEDKHARFLIFKVFGTSFILPDSLSYHNLYNRSFHPNRSPSLLKATGKVTKKLKPLYLALIKASSLFYKTYQCLQKIITSKASTIEIRVTLFLRLQILYSLILYKRSKKI